jgi:RNA polymerase sigma-70 factor (ECF subfamily)
MAEEIQTRLLCRIAEEDRSALGEFYDQMAGMLFSTAIRILNDVHEAEEVIQDVFVQIWEKAASFDPSLGSAATWAVSLTRNRSIDRLRSRQRRTRLAEQLEQCVDPLMPADGVPAQGGLAGDELAAVRSAVAGLPPEQRQAIEMAFFGGLTHQEIAESLREPLGTVKARIRRGMLKLRESLQPYV